MSTRVQKGGTIFKPVAKPRARLGSEVRQTSAVPEFRLPVGAHSSVDVRDESTSSATTAGNDASSMPPPATIPQRHSQPSPSRHQQPQASSSEPSQANESGAFPIAVLPRGTSRPPMIQSSPARLLPPHRPSAVSVPSASPIPVPSRDAPSIPVSASTPAVSSTVTVPMTPVPSAAPVPAPPHPVLPGRIETDMDSQIDPALITAVVTALRQADQSQSFVGILPGAEDPGFVQHDMQPSGSVGPDAPSESAPVAGDQDSAAPTPRRTSTRKSARRTETSSSDGAQGGSENDGNEEHDSDGEPSQKRKRKSSGAPRKRRSRAPSLPPYDPSADPGDEIDPTAVTMAELCEDMGRGRVSSKAAAIMSNHAAWRASNREKRARMRARMEAQKYGRNLDDEENAEHVNGKAEGNAAEQEAEDGEASAVRVNSGNVSRAQSTEPSGTRGDGFDYTQAMATSRYNVQVRIGPNGETIIDEASLFVDRHEEEDTAEYTHIEESDSTKFVNSATYSKKLRGSRWSSEETELFYDALSQFGENYELISLILPGRDRKACKNKFKAEDKRDPARITFCLKNRRPYDIATLSRMTGKDFSGPTPVIRAPTPIRMPETPQTQETSEPQAAEVEAAVSGSHDAEIVGDVTEMSDQE